MACKLVVLADERVKCFGDSDIYLICGKVICVKAQGIDMSDPKDVAYMIEFADRLYKPESRIRRLYGDRSICVLSEDCYGDLVPAVCSVNMLKDPEIKAAARRGLGFDG